MFKKILVANRGEIAVRVIRTLKEMGIQTVAIYSLADKDSLHVQLADEAVCVGGNKSQDSYLNMKAILSAAVGTGAEAIHPGFGFLSENSQFAQLCEQCGITFIGPKPETIELMGNKANARIQMQQSKVPVIPGSEGFIHSVDEAIKIANKVGYPVMLKAASGGGGKGIRLVKNEVELRKAFYQAQQEALSSFNDDRMYLEKVMKNVKHLEVQVFRDENGHVAYLPERDCSVQRNKQKIIEESPCSILKNDERMELGKIAIKATESLNYLNTGTIEFLMDEHHNFYFMEMNTRIQVEHTISEMVTGVDIVKAQVLIANGDDLPFTQDDLKAHGTSIECRVNAEDPQNNFCPASGTVDYLYLPTGNLGVRIDTELYPQATVSPFYDSMVAKVVSWGPTRDEAIAKMKRLLDEIIIKGIKTNIEFHQAFLCDNQFMQDNVSTEYLEKEFLPEWKKGRFDATL
ncbi:acetyl-CoA carboxylase biotin carboxylase subunit [Ligilactobacillus cholophilus]|uniref:acetyl-CoA carboxylase biotin carboxylase subunit n=1 Tax=Ligilactobacillus cholophilus TaxID=3050131 RepID=UPI0025AF64BB|nr:acetyl-CoA carboxylase biotin carboxylase subunit [Ligilactobacillus cholophilus]